MRVSLTIAAVIYALFAVACFRLAIVDKNDVGVSIGEGLFTLLGAVALAAALLGPARLRAPAALAGTLPLVVWFIATPWNSGPPFLVASLIVPVGVATALLAGGLARRRTL